MEQQLVNIKIMRDINTIVFPEVKENDRILWEDGKWYVYTNGTWIVENN